MELKGKKVLITGADGFIGSHLTERLVSLGCEVRALSYYNSFGKWGWLDKIDAGALAAIEVVSGDIRDPAFVRSIARDVEVIFHLAALIAIPYSYSAPDSYVQTNVTGTLNVVQAAREFGVAKVVHTSTSEVYGTAKYVPIDERHPLQPQSPYSASKIGADMIALSFFNSFSTPVAVIRPFNTFGPRQSARAVIPTLILQMLSGKRTISVGALGPTRDFNYVADTVEGFVRVAGSDSTVGEVVNIGSGREHSIAELAEALKRIIGGDFELVAEQRRLRPEKSEVERLLADNRKAAELAGWIPVHSFEEGLSKTVEWFRDNSKGYKADIYNI